MPYTDSIRVDKKKSQGSMQSDDNTDYILNGKKVSKAEYDASDEGYDIGGKKVSKAEFESQKIKNAENAKPKPKVYLVNGKPASKEQFDAVNKKNEEIKNKPTKLNIKPTQYKTEGGKNISKEEYEGIQKKNEENEKAGPMKKYKVDGKPASKEEFDAVNKKNDEIKAKKGLK
jgi:hypothetical protein